MWEQLPELLLEEILKLVSYKDRLSCATVCRNWYDTFLSPNVWRVFFVKERTFTMRLGYNHYKKEYNTKVNPYKVQMWLAKVGFNVKSLIVLPNSNFFHLYEFMTALATCLELDEEYPLPELTEFKFTFACESQGYTGRVVLGTGGRLLEGLKRLLSNLYHLKHLTLNQLLLDINETPGLLEHVVKNCGDTLVSLEMLNSTKERYPMFYAGMLPKLQRLVITPLQLTDDVVQMVAGRSTMKELVIVEDPYSGKGDPVSAQAWENVKRKNPQLKVRLEQRGVVEEDLTVQENAPVYAIVFNAPRSFIKPGIVSKIVRFYGKHLELYAHLGLPKTFPSRSFKDRCDFHAVFLVQQCPKLHTLAINERLSTATLLHIADKAHNLQELLVRRNAVLLKRDWPRGPSWSHEYYEMWRRTVRSYDKTAEQVSALLGQPCQMLSDAHYKIITL